MMRHQSALCGIVGATLATLVAGCGGDSFDSSQTVVSGLIVLPSSNNCRDCGNQRVKVVVSVLVEGGAPQAIKTVYTNTLGVYNTGDLTDELSGTDVGGDTDGDGRRSFTIVASVNDDPVAPAKIGGVLSGTVGADMSKDFNPTTYIACRASVLLTQGTLPNDPPAGCTVQTTCDPSDDSCLTIVDPDALTRERINNLEAAASTISAETSFPGDVTRAACAVLLCTASGTQAASEECVASTFAPEPR